MGGFSQWVPVPTAAPAESAWTPAPEPSPKPQPKSKPSALGRLWDWASRGLVSPDTFVRAMTGMTTEELNRELAALPEESPAHAAVREFVRGSVQDIADVASVMGTSPLAIGTLGAGAAARAPGAVGKAARALSGAASAGFAGEGAKEVAGAGLELTPEAWKQRLMGAAMVAGGAAGMAETKFPQQVGEAAKVSARTAGELAARSKQAFAARRAVKLERQTTTDFVRAVPPTKSTPFTPQDYQAARPYLEAEHASTPIKSVEGLRDAADSAVTKIEEQVSSYVAANPTDLITTEPLKVVEQATSGHPRAEFTAAGLRELEGLGLDQPLTLGEADVIRRQLNAENKAAMKKNRYDRATARATDPGFAAREAAAEALRDGIYGKLEERGIQGVRELRQDEGALLRVRNAAQARTFTAERRVGQTGPGTILRTMTGAATEAAGVGVGAAAGGWPGAIIGHRVGKVAARAVTGENLTANQLVERSFSKSVAQFPLPPTIPVRPIPAGLLPPAPEAIPPPGYTSPVPGIPLPPVAVPAQPVILREPRTGRMKRMYTEGTGGRRYQ